MSLNLNISAEIVKRATSGDHVALDSLIRKLQRPLYNLALRMMANHYDAEDATQEALLRIVTHLSSFRGESAFSTWAWTIATRVVLAQRRRRAQPPITVADFEADLALARDDTAVERIENAELLQQVKLGCGRAMLLCLDDDQRIAYVLADILGVPGPVAADVLNLSPAAFRKRASRARQAVRGNLDRLCGVVNPSLDCRCHKRIARAKDRDRLDPRDLEGAVSVAALRERIASIDKLSRHWTFYGADPFVSPGPELINQVRSSLGLSS
ncbi:MAG TPA: RNA polymerase sigma factor [Planctomycetes bacterium]|nr:RNA polymerase sigma factor [Planctomycetota bacterium]